MKSLTWSGFSSRLLVALVLVFTTYNPSGYSYYDWVRQVWPGLDPYVALAGILLVIGWVIYLRATLRSLGLIGLLLVAAVCACIIWLLFDWGVLSLQRRDIVAWVILSLQAFVLAVGISWSHIRRRLSGQVDIDDVDEAG